MVSFVFNPFSGLTGLTLLAFAATVTLALFAGRLRERRAANRRLEARMAAHGKDAALPAELPIEQEDPDLIERAAVARHIALLMLDNEWTEIGETIADWESRLATTPGGHRYHDIAAEVALSGLQTLIDDMPRDGLGDLAPAETELSHFVDTWRRSPDSHVLALLAARAHLVLGEACRADQWPDGMQRDLWRRMARHYVEAGDILARYDPLAHMSPLLAEAHYLQALGSPGAARKLKHLFEDWIDLDPANPAIYERHAEHLSDPGAVTDEEILSEADLALERTEEILGFGGYALFFLPLLDQREGARHLLDPELFASAMLDLATMSASQAEVNQTANALAAEMRADRTGSLALGDTLFMVIRGHLRVIYPRLWTLPIERVQALIAEAAEVMPEPVFEGGAGRGAPPLPQAA